MNMFAKENVGRKVRCLLEKDGEQAIDYVNWIHTYVDGVVKRKILIGKDKKRLNPENLGNHMIVEISDGWKIVEVDV